MICPNCGGKMEGRQCPYCGTDYTFASDTHRADAPEHQVKADFAPNRPAGGWKSDRVGDVDRSPVIQFLQRYAGSPLMLLSALFATLYAGGVCYTCGVSIFDTSRMLAGNHFDYYLSSGKINRIIFMIVCTLHLCMALWLMVSMWSLYGSGMRRKKTTVSKSCFNSFQMFSRVCSRLLLLLAGAALVTAAHMLIDPYSSNQVLNTFDMLTSHGAMQMGLAHAVTLFGENVIRAVVLAAVFFLNAIRCAMLYSVANAGSGMLQFGEVTYRKLPNASLMNLLCGLLSCAASVYGFAKAGTGLASVVLYGSVLACGLTSILGSIVLYGFTAGIRQMQR